MTERELIVPLRQERELQRRVKELEEALSLWQARYLSYQKSYLAQLEQWKAEKETSPRGELVRRDLEKVTKLVATESLLSNSGAPKEKE